MVWPTGILNWHLADDTNGPSAMDSADLKVERVSVPPVAISDVSEKWRHSLVQVEIIFPFPSAGRRQTVKTLGVIVDSKQGLVLIDSNRLVSPLADIRLIFLASVEVPATIFKQHPKHSMAILKYDSSLISVPVESAELADEPMNSGKKVKIVAFDQYGMLKVTDNQFSTPFNPTQFLFSLHLQPKHVAELMHQPIRRDSSDTSFATDTYSGMVINEGNKVIGFNIFPYGANPVLLSGKQIIRFMGQINNDISQINDLGVGVDHITVNDARLDGLPESWISKKPQEKFSFLRVSGIDQTASAATTFNMGDIILAINNNPVYEYTDLENLVQYEDAVKITLLRSGQIKFIEVSTVKYPFEEFKKVVNWQGMAVNEPLRTYKEISSLESGCVFISSIDGGSPAQKAKVWDTYCVVSVDDRETPDIEAFLDAVQNSSGKEIIKLKTVGVQSREVRHVDIRPDYIYWPTKVYQQDDQGHWEMKLLFEANTTIVH